MGHPVTTNPFIIMVINMTVVFLVLIVLMYVIKLIHFVDPTKEKETPAEAVPAPVAETVETAPAEEGISSEVIAVIAAAVAAYGYGEAQIQSIRPAERNGWKNSARVQNIFPN